MRHPLLTRQLKRLDAESIHAIDDAQSPLHGLICVIDAAYQAFDADRKLIEHSMELSAEEVCERNHQLLLKNQELEKAEHELRQSHFEMEQRVVARTEQLRSALTLAEAANRTKSAFLANMSHEIRTPMAAILGYADMLLEDGISQEKRIAHIETIRREGENLLAILNDILDISKIEADKLTIERITCDPCEMINEAVSLMRVRASQKNLACEVQYIGPIPDRITTDPTRFRQISLNLIGNAIKFTPSGTVRIEVSLDENAPMESARLRLDVIDTGIGMTDEQITHIFQPFAQADDSTTRRFGGTGLGLSISKRLANMLGGEISVKSTVGQGSRFTATVGVGDLRNIQCRSRHDQPPRDTKTKYCPSQNAQDVKNLRLNGHILLAEDGIHNQRVFQFYLEQAGADVTIAENGRAACELILSKQNQRDSFALVLMDMQMPELDGYDATRLLRREGFVGPIVAITAHAMAGDREKCLAAGCSDYLTKPIDRSALIRVAAQFMKSETATTPPALPLRYPKPSRAAINNSDLAPFLPRFVKELPGDVDNLRKHQQSQNLPALCVTLHNLKGTAGMFGFPDISEIAANAERRIRQTNRIESAADQITTLIDAISLIRLPEFENLDGSLPMTTKNH